MQRLNSKGCYISFLFALCSALNQAWLCVRLRRSFATLKITTLAEQSASKFALRSLNVLFGFAQETPSPQHSPIKLGSAFGSGVHLLR